MLSANKATTEKGRQAEVKFHISGITVLILYFVSVCGFTMPLKAFIPDAFSLALPFPLSPSHPKWPVVKVS